MNTAKYVHQLQAQLAAAAKAGSPAAQEVADHLIAALEPAARLMVADVLADAVDEITQALTPGRVDVRVRGDSATFVVETASHAQAQADTPEEVPIRADVVAAVEDETTARTTIRLPDALKQRAQEAANMSGVSLNTWITRAVTLHLSPGPRSRRGRAAAYYTGWTR